MLTLSQLGVVDRPRLGALVTWVPLAKHVAVAEEPLLGAGALLITACATEAGVELVLSNGVKQRGGLQAVAAGARTGFVLHAPSGDGVLNTRHDQALVDLGGEPIPVLHNLREVVPCVHVHEWKWQPRGRESLDGQVRQHDGVLAPAEEQHGALTLCGALTDDVHGLCLQHIQCGDLSARAHVAGPPPG